MASSTASGTVAPLHRCVSTGGKMRLRWFVALAWALLAWLAPELAQGQNVIVVLADDFSPAYIGAYGLHPDAPPTPNFDALAAQGVLFRNVWAYPTCSPTRASILTGRHPARHGVGRAIDPNTEAMWRGLDAARPNLAHILGNAGYRTAAIGKWHLFGFGAPLEDFPPPDFGGAHRHPNDSGFSFYAGYFWGATHYWDWHKTIQGTRHVEPDYMTTDTMDDAIAQLEGGEPFFLYLAPMAAHSPLHAPPAELHSFDLEGVPIDGNKDIYHAAMVEALDTEFGRFMTQVDLSTTTVIFLTDNGKHRLRSPPPPLAGGKGTLYEGGIRVPMIVAGQAVAESSRGRETTALVQATDVFATVLELTGVFVWAPDSVSILPYLTDPDTPSQRAWIHSERFLPNGDGPLDPAEYQSAARTERYKLLRIAGEPEEFYDLVTDPLEASPLDTTSLSTEEQAAFDLLNDLLGRVGADHWTFFVDEIRLERNGQLYFVDDFADGTPPPSAPDFLDAAPASWWTWGSHAEGTESAGRLRLEEADSRAGLPIAPSRHLLSNELRRDGSRSVLTALDTFSLKATFELMLPREIDEAYGLRLQVFADEGGGPEPKQALEVQVRRIAADQVQVELNAVHAVLGTTLVASVPLDPAHEQIQLILEKGTPGSSPVSASLAYVDGGVVETPIPLPGEVDPFVDPGDVASAVFFAVSSPGPSPVPSLSTRAGIALGTLITVVGVLARKHRGS